ncbi:MAG: hypothetical protein JRI34_11560 [Deltaproteobacteria bacterium]|nr:hypothetical protein [Deltaproteobacteria bacterium]
MAEDGWLDWKPITPDPHAKIISAYRQVWLSTLDPGQEMNPPGIGPLPPPRKEPFSRFDQLVSNAAKTVKVILNNLQDNTKLRDFSQSAQKLSQLSEQIRKLGFSEDLLKPIAAYFVLRLAGLDSTNPIKLAEDQLNLYLKVQASVRLLAEHIH